MIQLAGGRRGTAIQIEFSGLGPGAKLAEEIGDLLFAVVNYAQHGYSIATPRTINEKILQKTVSELAAAVVAEDQQAALKFLRHIVPEYSGAYSDASRQPTPAAAIPPVKAADDL